MVALSRRASNHLVALSVVIGALGIAVVALGLWADLLGLGDGPAFGAVQMITVVRGTVAVVGALLLCVYGLTERYPTLRPFVRAVRPLALILCVFTTLEAVVLAIGVLRVYTSSSMNARPDFIQDDQLGFRFREGSHGHDALGFRNPETVDAPMIVAIGDSMTWGSNASMDATWPSVLSTAARVSVYNMGVPGYGPMQYSLLAQQSQRLSPRILIIALYWGNDLVDAYRLVYSRPEHVRWRKPQSQPESAWWASTANGAGVAPRHSRFPLLRNSVYSAMVTGFELVSYRLRTTSAARPTVFTYPRRISALDLRREEVAEGLQLTMRILGGIAADAKASGTQLMLVAIPTKESAYAPTMPATAVNHWKVAAMETEVAEEAAAFCRARGIAYVETLPALRQGVVAGEAVYAMTADGHPTAHGYAIIADVVHAALRDRGWLSDGL